MFIGDEKYVVCIVGGDGVYIEIVYVFDWVKVVGILR